MSVKYEHLIASYLRLNAYFTVRNFIVHDHHRRFHGHIGNWTEIDVLGIRMPYTREVAGQLHIANHGNLISDIQSKIDVVIVEVKSGRDNTPNNVWRNSSKSVISYIVSFIGLHEGTYIVKVSEALTSEFRFEDDQCRLRYVIFSHEVNNYYRSKGITYITFRDVVSFLVDVRGQSWINCNLGVASCHTQWDEGLQSIFMIANKHELTVDERISRIESYLAS